MMKAPLLILCCLSAISAGPVVSEVGPPALESSAPAQELTREAWRKSFSQAMTIGSSAELKRLVKKKPDFASEWIVETAEAISSAPNDGLFERMDAFRKSWKAAWGTEFCNKMEVYFSLLDVQVKRTRARLRGTFAKKTVLYHENMNGEKLPHKFTALGMEFEGLAKAFSDLRDDYFTSRCHLFAANCYEEPALGKKDADLKRACKNYELYMDACDRIELKDTAYILTKERYTGLAALGFGSREREGEGEAGAEGEGKAGKARGPAGATINVDMEFDLVEKLSSLSRPSYFLDEIYPIWNSVSLNKKGSRATIARIENGPDVLRIGSADIQIDLDRDGEGDVDLPVRGKLEPVVMEIGEGPSKRKWAILAVTGSETDTYQGVQVNLSPNDDLVNIYYAPAGSMRGEVAGTSIRVLDDNLDGIYGSPAVAYGHIGLTKDNFQPEMDSIVIGKTNRALPWSEYQQIDGVWYKLAMTDGGTKLSATPHNVRTGSLKLKYKGPKASFVIVRGENDYANSFFDLTSGKSVDVPVGRYTLYFGLVTKGKKKQILKSVMLPSDTTPTWTVAKPDQEIEVELGSPFGFDWKAEIAAESVVVLGQTVCVTGVAGERYERVWGAVARPEVSYRKAGDKRGSKGEEMDKVQDQDSLYKSWKAPWFPLDIELSKRASLTDVEVQLTEKKNKLFGKITSVWK